MRQDRINRVLTPVARLSGARRAAVFALLLWPSVVAADSWRPPQTAVYLSPDAAVRLTVVPGTIPDRGPTKDAAPPTARGLLERQVRPGRWTRLWDRPLLNPVAPVSALVTDSGAYIVTFDDWMAVGTGPHTVVIYDRAGAVVRALALDDFVSPAHRAALPRSVSSVWWGGKHRIDGETLILHIAAAGDEPAREIPIALITGAPAACATC